MPEGWRATPAQEVPAAFGGNRAARRHPEKGQPVTVSREVPVTVLQHGDGSQQVVNHETDEPCFGCPCCALWSRSLDQLGAAMLDHAAQSHGFIDDSRAPLEPDECLICAMLAGKLDAASTGVDGG